MLLIFLIDYSILCVSLSVPVSYPPAPPTILLNNICTLYPFGEVPLRHGLSLENKAIPETPSCHQNVLCLERALIAALSELFYF